MQDELVPVGRIKRFFGTKGYVRVDLYSYNPEIGDSFKTKKSGIELKVENFFKHKNGFVIKFSGINSITEAQKLRNEWLLKPSREVISDLRTLYFVEEIAGFDVYTEQKHLGKLVDVLPTNANDIFVVKGKFEYLIPAKKEFINIDKVKKKINVKPPPGLIEIYEE